MPWVRVDSYFTSLALLLSRKAISGKCLANCQSLLSPVEQLDGPVLTLGQSFLGAPTESQGSGVETALKANSV